MLATLNRIKPHNLFLVVALIFELAYTIFTPPLQAPDEISHFYRAYQIADGHILPVRTANRLGGEIPVCFNEFVLPFTFATNNIKYTLHKKEIIESLKVKFNGKEKEFKDFPSTTTYSPISYLPQIIAVFILKQLNCSVALLYYGGRLFSFIFWLVIMFYVIKIIPIYKWMFTTIILLPMNLYVTNAYSADGMNNCLSFLFFALVLRHMFSEKKLQKRDILLLLLVLTSLALSKFVYVSFITLLFLIPSYKFKSKIYRFGSIALIFGVSVSVFLLWTSIYMKNYIRISEYDQNYIYGIGLSPCADPVAQKAYILSHPTYFLKVIYHSIFNHPNTYLKGYIGAFGQSDILLPYWLYVFTYIIVIFFGLTECNKIVLTKLQKGLFFCSAFSAFLLILLSIHLMWDCVGEGVVDLVQGRYLIPIFPLLFVLFSNKKLQLHYLPIVIILPLVLILHIFSIKSIINRFYKSSYYEKTEFYCNAEEKTATNYFKTSNDNVVLENGLSQTSNDHRSGNYALLLTPENPFGLTYRFNNLGKGDLIEMEVWKKGDDGEIVLSGKAPNCKDLYASKKQTVLIDKNGWAKIHCVFTIVNDCSNYKATLYLWNPGRENVYFDDFKFSLKKFKPYNL
ncbi:MAG: DUF2142 domain-containing protein [Bacteroidota bacterium]|nr:DUF2142 domain-containing protein [Bacteroidota bacterium]